jgi:hypothetical protein
MASGAVECARVFPNARADPNAVDNPQHQFYGAMNDFECYVRRPGKIRVPLLHLATQEPDIRHVGAITRLPLDSGTNSLARSYDGQILLYVAIIKRRMLTPWRSCRAII